MSNKTDVLYCWIPDRSGKMHKIVVENGRVVAQLIDHKKYLLTDSEAVHYQEQASKVLNIKPTNNNTNTIERSN